MTTKTLRPLGLLLLSILIAACGKGGTSTGSGGSAPGVSKLRPADPNIAKIFDNTCHSCHAAPGSPAPQVGDRAAWEPRLAQGMPTLLAHTVSGYKGMPPLGSCSDCGEPEFTALIEFMALGKGAAP